MNRNTISSKMFVTLLFVLGFFVVPLQVVPEAYRENTTIETLTQLTDDLSGVTVGLYQSYYSSTDQRVNQSRIALAHMFTWMNATLHIINKTDILNGALWACEIFAVPEGLGPSIQVNMGYDVMDMIKEWIALGGSYIGVRGSSTIAFSDAYFEGASEIYYMELINGTSIGMPGYASYSIMSEINIAKGLTDGPDLSNMPATMSVYWQTGRYFEAAEGQEMITIATYEYNNQPAMVAARYGQGNVFASSPQFEYEEDSDRDGTDYRDSFDDPDSEWPLLLEICKWMIEDSSAVANTTTWRYPSPEPTETTANDTLSAFPISVEALVIVGSIGAVVIIAAAVVLRRRG